MTVNALRVGEAAMRTARNDAPRAGALALPFRLRARHRNARELGDLHHALLAARQAVGAIERRLEGLEALRLALRALREARATTPLATGREGREADEPGSGEERSEAGHGRRWFTEADRCAAS